MPRFRENLIEIANFAAGTRDAPAFEGSGGASRMVNYLVDFDGEVVARKGYITSEADVLHIKVSDDDRIPYEIDEDKTQTGPLFLVETEKGERQLFRIAEGASYVLQKDRVYVAESHAFLGGYWIDISQGIEAIQETPGEYIHRWGPSTRPGQYSATAIAAKSVSLQDSSGAGTDTIGKSSFTHYYVSTVPTIIRIEVYVHKDTRFDVKIYDTAGREVDHFKENQDGRAGSRYTYTWDTRSRRNPSTGETFAAGLYVPAVIDSAGTLIAFESLLGKISHPLFLGLNGYPPSPDNPLEIRIKIDDNAAVADLELRVKQDKSFAADDTFWEKEYKAVNLTPGQELKNIWRGEVNDDDKSRYVSAAEYEEAYFEVIFGSSIKRRYYLFGHRDHDTAGGIQASLQAGYQIYKLGSVFGPHGQAVGAAAGAVAAIGGSVATLVGRETEGERVQIRSHRTAITPVAKDETGFYPGIIAYLFTWSDTAERRVESLPSTVKSFILYDFEGKAEGARTLQGVDIELMKAEAVPPRYKFLNIYATYVRSIYEDGILPQSLGLSYRLIAQIPRAGDKWLNIGDDNIYKWRNESAIDPSQYLEQFDNDPPPSQLSDIVSYGSRLWGINRRDETIIYSKLAPYGYHHFPFENALVPQSISLDESHSKIVRIFPASNDSMLYVFKRDRIHFIRGGGEVQGLHSPTTPVDINIDASIKKENIGTYAPRSITTLKDTILFLGSDKILYELSGLRVRPFSISIQPHIEKYSDEELEGVIAFEYRNCYHLCLPNEVLVLDLQKKYWTIFDWKLREVFWAQDSGREESDNTLYAIDADGNLLQLYKGDKDGEDNFTCEWESNPTKIAYESVISGVHVYHDESNTGALTVGLKINNDTYDNKSFTPSRSNRFRQGMHSKGHRVQVIVKDENEKKLRIDRIALEMTR